MYSFFSSLGTLLSHRLGTFMTIMVLGIAMALPLGLFVTVNNLSAIDLQRENWGTITVFLHREVGEDQALALLQRISEKSEASAEAVSPARGLDEFRQTSGFGQAVEMFEKNPLPWVLLVTPRPVEDQPLGDVVTGLEDWLRQMDEVDVVQVDYKWLQRLAGLLELGEAIVTVLSVLFSLGVVVVVSNTIRLDVASRSEEIQILSLVGAGNSFIRQPFLYSGFWYGLLGSLVAVLLLSLSMLYLKYPLERLLASYGSSFALQSLGLRGMCLVLLTGGLLGFVGAWVSVQHYLRRLNESGMLGRR
jgi:cell division transport system permease protein